jgi:RNA polymerase sigma-70 factor, ECF subfamily
MSEEHTKYVQQLYEQHGAKIQRYLSGMVRRPAIAEELTQETFLAVLEDPPASLNCAEAYLTTIGHNKAVDHLRREGVEVLGHAGTEPAASDACEPSHQISREELDRAVFENVRGLPDDSRDLVVMRFLMGMPYRMLVKRLGVSRGGVEARMRKALAHLHGRLAGLGFDALPRD